jgi:hypothetical protein
LGETALSTPYVWLHQAFGGMFRVPARFAPVAVIPLLVFAFQMFEAHRRFASTAWRRYGFGICTLLLIFAESRLYQPMPLMPAAPHYDFYQALGREQGAPYDEMVIVDIPNAGGTGEAWVGEFPPMETQFYAIIHHKRVLNGSIARAPFGYYWYWLVDDPLLAWLGQRRFLEPAVVEPLLRARIPEWRIGYFILHQRYLDRLRFPSSSEEVIGYFNALPDVVCPTYIERDVVAFRTFWHPDGCPPRLPPQTTNGAYQIDIGTTGDERFIGWGWHRPESIFDITLRWAGEYPQTQVYLDLPTGGYELTFTAQAFWENRTVQVLVNGVPLGAPLTITTDALREYTVSIPAEVIGDGQHITLTLVYDAVVVPAEVGQSADPRRLALAVDWLRFTSDD